MPPLRRLHLTPILAAALASALLPACGSDERPLTVAKADQEGAAKPAVQAEAVAVTRNTSRIDGVDPVADAAQVALATHPRFDGAPPVEAVAVVEAGDWQAGIAASVLAGEPLRAPILLSESGSVPDETDQAIATLKPQGGSGPADAAAYAIGDVAVPDGVQATEIKGDGAAGLASAVNDLRQRLTGRAPAHIVLVSDAEAAFAMPAAAWAARSGDPVLFVGKDSVPEPTIAALKKSPDAAVYLLGPTTAASEKVLREVQRVAPSAKRIAGNDPVVNAIEFARFADSSFGWNINDPGHGLVIANDDRPSDAGAAAALSSSGTYGPLLLLDNAGQLPTPLRDYLLDIKPGFQEDPTRALYNRVWLIGDDQAISGAVQAQIDELAELAPIPGAGGGTGGPTALPSGPTGAEQEPTTPAKPRGKK